MSASARRTLLLVGASALLFALGVAIVIASGGSVAHADDGGLFLPLALRRFDGPFPTPEPASTLAATVTPSATATGTAGPTSTDDPERTPSTTPTPSATDRPVAPTPTTQWDEVRYPMNPDTIILQIGRTDTTQSSQVFEEMNGTPWLTVYGDGRVIAGRELFDNRQPLFVGTADRSRMQQWLRRLVHGVGLYDMGTDYHHPRAVTPEVHVYAYTNDGAKRVSLRSFKQFEDLGVPEDVPDAESVQALIVFVRDLESELTSEPAASATPFAPDCYTVLAQQLYGFEHMADQFETWEHSLNVRTVAEAAPTAASNYEGKVVGHKFVDGDLGREIQSAVRPQWEFWFGDENMAAAFRIGRLPYAVGARQEVPGGSRFLPSEGFDTRGAFWYRRDPGSGSCASLPRRLAPAAEIDMLAWLARWFGTGPAERTVAPIAWRH